MNPFRSRSPAAGAVSLAVAVLLAAPALPSYAVERPHTHDDYVAHGAWLTTSHGIVDRARPLLQVSDVNQVGRVAGLVSWRTTQRPACWGVVRPDGHRVFRTCGSYLDSFSPDGHRVLVEHSQAQWQSVRRFAILGHDGRAVRSWTFDSGRYRSLSQLTWEDSHHLLGVLLAHGRWGLVRIGTDGTVEYAGAPVAVVNEFAPYSLPLR